MSELPTAATWWHHLSHTEQHIYARHAEDLQRAYQTIADARRVLRDVRRVGEKRCHDQTRHQHTLLGILW